MLTVLKNFDPISFLKISTGSMSVPETAQLKASLNSKIGEYLLLKLSDDLSEDQYKRLIGSKDLEEMAKLAQSFIPDLEKKIDHELDNFKKEYQEVLQKTN